MRIFYVFTLIISLAACNNGSREIFTDESLMGYKPYVALTDSLVEKPSPELYFRRGLLSYKLQSYRSAYKDYSVAFKGKPSHEYAEAIVSSMYTLKLYDSVILFVEKEKKHFPDNRYHEIMSLAFENLGEYIQAMEHNEALIKADTGNYYLRFQKANLQINLGDTAGAIKNYETCLQQLPDFPDVKFALGDIYSETGNSRTLYICDLMMKDTVNFHAEPYFLRAVYYSKTLQPAKAYSYFNDAIGKDWKYIDAYIQKGVVQFNNKEYEAAQHTFEMALSVNNTNADIYYWIGRCKETQGKKEEAIDYYKKTLGLDGEHEEAATALKRLEGK